MDNFSCYNQAHMRYVHVYVVLKTCLINDFFTLLLLCGGGGGGGGGGAWMFLFLVLQ